MRAYYVCCVNIIWEYFHYFSHIIEHKTSKKREVIIELFIPKNIFIAINSTTSKMKRTSQLIHYILIKLNRIISYLRNKYIMEIKDFRLTEHLFKEICINDTTRGLRRQFEKILHSVKIN